MNNKSVWCPICEANGYTVVDGKNIKCKSCGGFGFIDKSDNSKDKSEVINLEDDYDNETISPDEVPPPPSTEAPDINKTKNSLTKRRGLFLHVDGNDTLYDYRNVSVWKFYTRRLNIAEENLKCLIIMKDFIKKFIFNEHHSGKETIKILEITQQRFKKINENCLEFTTTELFIDIIEKELVAKHTFNENIEDFKKFIDTIETKIKDFKINMKKIKKSEEILTKNVVTQLQKLQKSRQKCNTLIQKMCESFADLEAAQKNEQETENSRKSFFSIAKKPDKINKKLEQLVKEAHKKASYHEDINEQTNDIQKNFFENDLKDICNKIDDLEIEINKVNQDLGKRYIQMKQKISEIQTGLANNYEYKLKEVQVLADTPKCSKKIHDEEGPLTAEQFILEYDLSLRPEDVLAAKY